MPDLKLDEHVLPKGIWLTFDFDDSHPVFLTPHLYVYMFINISI